ncbi:MAG: RES family NAD+ phosphorylase [Mangrovibacterium sp.]
MKVYRITREKFATLSASGYPGRWNSEGIYVLYAAEHRSLAILENIAHNPVIPILDQYVTMVIDIPDELSIQTLDINLLPKGWNKMDELARGICQAVGDDFITRNDAVVFRVPSAIVPQEWNMLINTAHPDFPRLSVAGIEPFEFDPRIAARETD